MARRAERPARLRRVGLFGGTFDPPHRGHVAVAGDVVDALGLDELVWMVAGSPPHKTDVDVTPAAVRLEMTRAAAASDRRFRVSDLEVRRRGPSYTVDTLRALAEPSTELLLVVGIDQFRELERWREPKEILRLATLAVMDRGGESLDPDEARGVVRAPVRRIDVSSTQVRARVARGEDISDLVPRAVAGIIEREGLYRADP